METTEQQQTVATAVQTMATAPEVPIVEPAAEDQKEGGQLLWQATGRVQTMGADIIAGKQ